MTVGDKIRSYRELVSITQKELGIRSGISESTIRKYELGLRNPKPAQIKKISDALDIGINMLMDDEFNINTVGDFMSVLFSLEDSVDIEYDYIEDENKNIDPSTIKLSINNTAIVTAISEWILYNKGSKERNEFIESKDYNKKELNRMKQLEIGLTLAEKMRLMEKKEEL